MLLVELNRKGEALKEILMGICLNSGKTNVSLSATRIVAKDLKNNKPNKLYHCYIVEELVSLIASLSSKKDISYCAKEIIPTDGDLGIVRKLEFNYEKPETLANQIWENYRYYIIINYIENGESKCVVITYNPDIRELTNINVDLSETLRVNCGTMQFGDVRDLNRLMSVKNVIDETEGTYIIYKLEEDGEDA